MIHSTALINAGVKLSEGVTVGAYAILGDSDEDNITIGSNTTIGHHTHLFGDVQIGANCNFDSFTRVGPLCKIGNDTKLLYGARVHYDVIIGDHCSIAGNCPDNCRFGNHVIHLGKISHSFYYPFSDWDAPEEPGPTIGSHVVIGTDANIIGPVNIGNNCFIFPREILRVNVPDDSIYQNGKVKYMPHWAKYLRSLGSSHWTIKP